MLRKDLLRKLIMCLSHHLRTHQSPATWLL
nr:MAG TPA: hypothetical protein [Caudoviricetes sp.]